MAASAGPRVVTVNELLDGQVVLDIECLDRIYLSGFVNSLQTPGGVIYFLHHHRGMPIASPAVFAQIGDAFRRAVGSFAGANHIPMVRLRAADRNAEVMRPYLDKAAQAGRSQVAAIGVAQEPQIVWTARQRDTDPGKPPQFSFTKENRRVTVYYFYLWDEGFGPAFIKICAYFPYPVKVWVNGHEWAKRQAIRAGLPFTELSNGFASCEDPAALQAICDRLGPGHIRCSPSAGGPGCRCRSPAPTGRPATGGTSPCARSRSPRPSPSPPRGTPGRSSRPSPPTTWTSAARTTWRSSSTGRSAASPRACSALPSTGTTTASWSTPSTGTPASRPTSKTAGRCGSRPSSTTPTTSACCAASSTSAS